MLKTDYRQRFLVPPPPPPAIRYAMAKATEREEKGLPVVDFSSGNVGRLPLNLNLFIEMKIEVNGDLPEELLPLAEALKRGILDAFYPSPKGLAYSPTGGTGPVKGQVIRYFREVHGVPLTEKDTDRVIATTGGQQCMALTLRSLKPGTNVLLSQWDYSPLPGIIQEHGCREIRVKVNEDLSIDKEDLEKKITRGSVFYVSMPNNPSGYVSSADLETVARTIRENNGGLIWDAPYLFTILRLTPSRAEFDKKFLQEQLAEFKKISGKYYDDMCILSSISKTCLSAGLRFGFGTASAHWIEIMDAILGREGLSSPTPLFIMGTHILRAFLDNPITHEWLCEILAKRLTVLMEEDIPLILPRNRIFGALYALVKTEGIDGDKFASQLIDKHGIVTVPGNSFYGGPVNAIRLSLVATPWTDGDEDWTKSVKTLKKALEH